LHGRKPFPWAGALHPSTASFRGVVGSTHHRGGSWLWRSDIHVHSSIQQTLTVVHCVSQTQLGAGCAGTHHEAQRHIWLLLPGSQHLGHASGLNLTRCVAHLMWANGGKETHPTWPLAPIKSLKGRGGHWFFLLRWKVHVCAYTCICTHLYVHVIGGDTVG
jgi:hypothetical protein